MKFATESRGSLSPPSRVFPAPSVENYRYFSGNSLTYWAVLARVGCLPTVVDTVPTYLPGMSTASELMPSPALMLMLMTETVGFAN